MYINTHTDYHSPAGTQYQQHENCIKRCSHQQRVESNQSNDSCRLWQQDEINWPSNKYMQLSTVKRYKSWTQQQHVACRLTWCGKCFIYASVIVADNLNGCLRPRRSVTFLLGAPCINLLTYLLSYLLRWALQYCSTVGSYFGPGKMFLGSCKVLEFFCMQSR